MRSRIIAQGLICSPIARSGSEPACINASLTGSIAVRAWRSCTTSRGVIRPAATLDISRSRSPVCSSCSRRSSLSPGFLKKYSTQSSRSLMSWGSFNGNVTHRRSIRAPIGLTVLSITSSRLFPSSPNEQSNSRLRMVNLSRRTNVSSSIRLSRDICPIRVCFVISR